ncbi:MAG: hypothetical protein ACR2IE_17600 [Candidatus Sumerlaeaceae bacterium]
MAQPREQELSSRRGGNKNSPLHFLHLLVSTLLLVTAAVLLIREQNLLGTGAMLLGGIVAFLNFRHR